MKRIFICLATLLILSMSVVPAFATSEEGGTETSPTYITVAAPDVYVTVEDDTPVVTSVANETGVSVNSSFESAIISIFGEYTPRTQTVIVYLDDGSTLQYEEYVTGLAGLDWVWISGVGLFALFLFCLMKLLGGAVK